MKSPRSLKPQGRSTLLGWTLACLSVVSLSLASVALAHDHVNAGALGSQPGGSLSFINGDRYAVESGYVVALGPTAALAGPRAGLFSGSITFTALAATADYGGPAFGHAVLGSHLAAVVTSVRGPVGGRFGFWEAAEGEEGAALTWELPVGTEDALVEFVLSETAGEAGDDPYGHIHGRQFTASVPGLYVVEVRVEDRSANGPASGPWHTPSAPLALAFQAGVTISGLRVETGEVVIRYAALEGMAYQLERSATPGADAVWQDVGGVVIGKNRMQEERVPAQAGATFFRLRGVAL
ncbi:MAG: hypothetical protein IT580_08930 [Verrucomicrobiales bacterium]|nr:hypothetical protein [Verrucomicrobiales bacterium]